MEWEESFAGPSHRGFYFSSCERPGGRAAVCAPRARGVLPLYRQGARAGCCGGAAQAAASFLLDERVARKIRGGDDNPFKPCEFKVHAYPIATNRTYLPLMYFPGC